MQSANYQKHVGRLRLRASSLGERANDRSLWNLIFKRQRPNYILASVNQIKSVDASHNLWFPFKLYTDGKPVEYVVRVNLFTEKPVKRYHNVI